MQSFRDTTVLITGASDGIGAAMARRLAPEAGRLLLTARSADRLERVAADVRARGGRADVYPHDLAVAGAADALVGRLHADGHAIDVLVNNAGFGTIGPFLDVDVSTYAEMVTLNTASLVALTRRLLPGMLARGHGGVLNVASTAAFQPVPYMAVYAATKSFVLHFTEALHGEVRGRGVAVTCLAPGPTRTGFAARAGSDRFERFAPVQTADEVAAAGRAALLGDERLRVSGLTNAVGATLGRLAPRGFVLALVRRALA